MRHSLRRWASVGALLSCVALTAGSGGCAGVRTASSEATVTIVPQLTDPTVALVPESLTVAVGEKITWVNRTGAEAHIIFEGEGIPMPDTLRRWLHLPPKEDNAKEEDLPQITTIPSFSAARGAFRTPGTFSYKIIVTFSSTKVVKLPGTITVKGTNEDTLRQERPRREEPPRPQPPYGI